MESWWRWPDKLFKKTEFLLSPFCFPIRTCLKNYPEEDAANLFQVFIILTTREREREREKKRRFGARMEMSDHTANGLFSLRFYLLFSHFCSPQSFSLLLLLDMGAMVIWFSCFFSPSSVICFSSSSFPFLFFVFLVSSGGRLDLEASKAISALDNVSPYGYGLALCVCVCVDIEAATRALRWVAPRTTTAERERGRFPNKQFNT